MGSRCAVCLSSLMWSLTGWIELAAMAPDAAADGVPIPGKHESPQRRRPTGRLRETSEKGPRRA